MSEGDDKLYFKYGSLLVLLNNPSICLDLLRINHLSSAACTCPHPVVRLVNVFQTIDTLIYRGVIQAHPRIVLIEACLVIFILAATFIEAALFQGGID